MIRNKFFLLGLAFALIVVIFLFVPTKKRGESDKGRVAAKVGYTLVQYQADFYKKQPDSVQNKINLVEEKIARASDSLTKVTALTEAIAYYNQIESPEIAAWLIYQKAEIIHHTNSWKITGDNFISLIADMKMDTTLFGDVSKYATLSYEKSIALDSNNDEAKLQLAQCYMELVGQPMQGVQILLGLVKQNPQNVKAQLLLAKFGLVSEQFEKVFQRLENVLSLQPHNRDALLMRAEAYARTGKNAEAIKDLKQVKADAKTPAGMKEQLEMAIRDLETKK